TTRKRNPDILQVIAIYSPKGRYDQLYLSNFATIKIKDELARVEGVGDCQQFGQQDYSMRIWLDPEKLASLNMNASDVAAALRERFPDDIDYTISLEMTPFIEESIKEVIRTLVEAIILVAIVVLIFLQNWRSALIPLVAVPVAVVGTFAAMAAIGFSLNQLTLFGLVLAIGIVVDDAIVVVEAVEHHIE